MKVTSISAAEGAGYETGLLSIGSDLGEFHVHVDHDEALAAVIIHLRLVANDIENALKRAGEIKGDE